MSDYGRIHKGFHSHAKVEKAGNAAIGLWVRAMSFCKAHRTGGHISLDAARNLGTNDEIDALVRVRLWEWNPEKQQYRFRDWDEWNASERPKSLAARLVHKIVPDDYPDAVRQKLSAKVSDLLAEDIEPVWIERALKAWLSTPNAGVGLLPFLISDLMRQGQQADLSEVLRQAHRTGDISPLARLGHIFTPPDTPDGLDVPAIRKFMLGAKREWIAKLREELNTRG